MERYDIVIVGAGAAGAFAAVELAKRKTRKRVLVIDQGASIENRSCPITEGKVDHCVHCQPYCKVMAGFGGAGTLSDGKYNITNAFGGDLHAYLGDEEALALMRYVDGLLLSFDHSGMENRLYSTASSDLKTLMLQHDLHLLDAQVRHFGTDRNLAILKEMYHYTKDVVRYRFETRVEEVVRLDPGNAPRPALAPSAGLKRDPADAQEKSAGFRLRLANGELVEAEAVILACGRSGCRWMSRVLEEMEVGLKANRVDIGVRLELPAEVFRPITDQVYEAKVVYQTKGYNDLVRTFCMNPYGAVVAENTNGIITVNGHAYADPARQSENTNFALLVSNHFTEPFKDSNGYGESIARLSNMLGGGVLLQRFGDLIRGRRSSESRMAKCFTRPTLSATPGDLSLVMPKRQLDDIIEMIYALDQVAPGTANEDTLLYGVEVKFYNSLVEVDDHFQTRVPGLFAIGDGSGVTHSLSQAAASGVYMARLLG